MRVIILINLMLISFITLSYNLAFAGTAIKINSASVDVSQEKLYIKGINFDAFTPLTVTIGNILLHNCTVTPTDIDCSLTGTPVLTEGGASWNVSISAGNASHLNDDIDVFVLTEEMHRGCLPGSFVECYSSDPATRNVGECNTGISTCSNNGTWSDCAGEAFPETEICDDNKDNDCDGLTDIYDPDCGCEPLQIVSVEAWPDCSTVVVTFNQAIDDNTLDEYGSQFNIPGLDPMQVGSWTLNRVWIATLQQQSLGTFYELTVDSSLLNLCGRGVDPEESASFYGCGFEQY